MAWQVTYAIEDEGLRIQDSTTYGHRKANISSMSGREEGKKREGRGKQERARKMAFSLLSDLPSGPSVDWMRADFPSLPLHMTSFQ